MRYDETHDLHRHRDDHWLDEIRLVGEDGPLLRLVLRYRYKTSGLSGGGWRTSTTWQMQGDVLAPGGWGAFGDGYGRKLEAGCAALYPLLCAYQFHNHAAEILRVEFLRKGRVLHTSGGGPLLTVAGGLSWAMVCTSDEPLGTEEAWADHRRLCHQPGCAEKAASTYALRHQYDLDGKPSQPRRPLVHRFCPLHLRRGDGGREDNDANYVVLDGPGPEAAVGWREYESRAVLM